MRLPSWAATFQIMLVRRSGKTRCVCQSGRICGLPRRGEVEMVLGWRSGKTPSYWEKRAEWTVYALSEPLDARRAWGTSPVEVNHDA